MKKTWMTYFSSVYELCTLQMEKQIFNFLWELDQVEIQPVAYLPRVTEENNFARANQSIEGWRI